MCVCIHFTLLFLSYLWQRFFLQIVLFATNFFTEVFHIDTIQEYEPGVCSVCVCVCVCASRNAHMYII